MTFAITPIYGAILTLIYLVLIVRVIIERRTHKFAYGDNGSPRVHAKIRAAGNWAEVVPIALILMIMIEAQGVWCWGLHAAGALLVVGRLLHGYSMSFVPKQIKLRMVGMLLTLIALLGLVVMVLPIWG